MADLFHGVFFEQREHGQQTPHAGQQRGDGERLRAFHLSSAESYQHLPDIVGLWMLTPRDSPHSNAGHAGHEQASGYRVCRNLLPLLDMNAK